MQDIPSYRGTSITKDQLHRRMDELAQLINRNNHQFNKGVPSQTQLSNLLDHTSDCYDQLAFLQNQQAA
jgi:ABC-type transporter Mla subunit MlaD